MEFYCFVVFKKIPIDFTTPRINALLKTNENVKYTCTFKVFFTLALRLAHKLAPSRLFIDIFLHIVNI